MAHVTTLAQHILSLEPDKDAARLCLYHFLKNLCEPSEPVNAELMNRFFCRALAAPHWQENKLALFNETHAILQHFQDVTRTLLPLNGIFRAEDIQAVPIDNLKSLESIVQRHLERSASPYDQFRAVPEANDRVVALVLQGDRSLRVTVFPKVAAIREGELVPLHQEYTLYYTPELTLHPMMIQQMEIGPHAAARFRAGPEGIMGTVVRGYTFQKYAQMNGGALHRYPVLFYPLKRLEQFFVNRKTDPMYVELTHLLEQALDLTNQHHPEAMKFAEAALERGRLALEHIFPDDKLVRLLINNLEKTVALEATLNQQHASPRSTPDVEQVGFARRAMLPDFIETDADPDLDPNLGEDLTQWPHAKAATRDLDH